MRRRRLTDSDDSLAQLRTTLSGARDSSGDADADDAELLRLAASSSSSVPCMFCGETVLSRAALTCCSDAMACYWCASSERRLGGVCVRCHKPL